MLNAATILDDLRIPPGNQLESLSRNRKGQHSIRIMRQWRISADTALRLSRYFGTSPQFWMNLQDHYELEVQEELLANRLEEEVKVLQTA